MNNINKIVNNDLCSGCGICVGICPLDAISIFISDTGFYRPNIDMNRCVNCDKCLSVCPSNKRYKPNNLFGEVKNIYSGWAKDKDIRYKSASGGIATALSLELLKEGYYVAGTKYDEVNIRRTKSIVCNNVEGILEFSSSKYMPSEYSTISKFIKENPNSKLCVIGLPCQIAGIRNMIGYDKDNIVLIDILCGKTMSYILFDNYVNSKEISNLQKCDFRNKDTSWYNYSILLYGENKTYLENFRMSTFGKFLNSKIFTQTQCYYCNYGSAGLSDITLGDYWDKERFEKETCGVSQIITRTEKGEKILKNASNLLIKIESVDDLLKTQGHFLLSKGESNRKRLIKKNNNLYMDLNKVSLNKLCEKYTKVPFYNRLKGKMRRIFLGDK